MICVSSQLSDISKIASTSYPRGRCWTTRPSQSPRCAGCCPARSRLLWWAAGAWGEKAFSILEGLAVTHTENTNELIALHLKSRTDTRYSIREQTQESRGRTGGPLNVCGASAAVLARLAAARASAPLPVVVPVALHTDSRARCTQTRIVSTLSRANHQNKIRTNRFHHSKHLRTQTRRSARHSASHRERSAY